MTGRRKAITLTKLPHACAANSNNVDSALQWSLALRHGWYFFFFLKDWNTIFSTILHQCHLLKTPPWVFKVQGGWRHSCTCKKKKNKISLALHTPVSLWIPRVFLLRSGLWLDVDQPRGVLIYRICAKTTGFPPPPPSDLCPVADTHFW